MSRPLAPEPPATADVPSATSPPTPEHRDITELYHAHRLELVRLAALLTDDTETAQDVVQDAFAAAYKRHGPTLAGLDDPLRYLRRSVVNGARSVLRRRRTARAWVPPHVPPSPSPEDDAIRAEEDQQLRVAIDNLRPRQREVLVLRYYAGLTEAEIARTLGMAQGTVKSTANRALKSLHRMLEAHR
ncbi:RNA polymerase sigma factor [Yinghuangia sp. YIM S10712]|uniref:RNA polymerase sigma factor n=1 Tax=Yinghuangia sp. YIM S10712 TaxID=3436930 RepID=UPI003F535178